MDIHYSTFDIQITPIFDASHKPAANLKTTILPLLLLILSFYPSGFINAQEASSNPSTVGEKGVTPRSSPLGEGREGASYAVVTGTSDDQDEGIPDLRFAERNAEASFIA